MSAMRNHALYINIVACIAARAMPATSICKKLGAGAHSVRSALFEMRACGVAYIASHKHGRGGKGDPAAVWRAGMQQGLEPARDYGRDVKPRSELVAFSILMRCLMTEPTSVSALKRETGLHRATLYKILRLGKELGVLHIAAYERDARAGDYSPCWKLSPGAADVEKPAPRDMREIWREYDKRKRALKRQLQITHALAANSTHFTEAA